MIRQALVFSNDLTLIAMLREALSAAGVETLSAFTPVECQLRLGRNKLDAVIVDCESLEDGLTAMRFVRQGTFNQRSVVFAVLHDRTHRKDAYEAGADFVLHAPVTAEEVRRSVHAAGGLMLRERRRYYRHVMALETELGFATGESVPATILDLSEGGFSARLHRRQPLSMGATMTFRFLLPESEVILEGKAELAWFDISGRCGLHITSLRSALRLRLEEWIQERLVKELAGS
jgi:CheY-like chemotaxis protein